MNVVRASFNRVRPAGNSSEAKVGRTSRAYATSRIAFASLGMRDISFALQERHSNDEAPFRIKRFFRDNLKITKFRSSVLKRSAILVENSLANGSLVSVEMHVDLVNTPSNLGATNTTLARFTFDAGDSRDTAKAMNKFMEFFDTQKNKAPYVTLNRIPAVNSMAKWVDRDNHVLWFSIESASLHATPDATSVRIRLNEGKQHMNITLEELEKHTRLANLNGRFLVINKEGRFGIYNRETFNLRFEVQ